MQFLVVCNKPCKRTAFFLKAAHESGRKCSFITYAELLSDLPVYKDSCIKLEPPVYDESGFVACSDLYREYRILLKSVSHLERPPGTFFMNTPESLLLAMDKAETKKRLSHLNTTPLLSDKITGWKEVEEIMREKRIPSVFIKPRLGAGAGGILAVRKNFRTGNLVAYTTLGFCNGILSNTKKTHRLTEEKRIENYIQFIVEAGGILEEWIPKEQLNGENYDLRVVCLDGQVEYVVVRCSNGVITNLHLNNKAHRFEELALPVEVIKNIFHPCKEACRILELRYAGMDVLLKRDTTIPYIIEVNGQGDHIYQDMYNENRIYKSQIKQTKGSDEY